jgi:hypothetical protein
MNFGTLFACHRGAAEVIRSQEEEEEQKKLFAAAFRVGLLCFFGVFFFQVLLMMEECDGFLPYQVLQDISAELMKEMKQTEPAAAAGFDTW